MVVDLDINLIFGIFGALVVIWILLNLKRGRADGQLVKNIHPFRTMLLFACPNRQASTVYFDVSIKAQNMEAFLKKQGEESSIMNLLVWAGKIALENCPEMNRFCSGNRLYLRNGVHISFTVKKDLKDRNSKTSFLKLNLSKFKTFEDLCERIKGGVKVERSDEETYSDKEHSFFSSLPNFIFGPIYKLAALLDYYNLLPFWFYKEDGLFTSLIITNLGSLKMKPGFHHLYEWGNCPIFAMVGKVKDEVIAKDGKVEIERVLPIRISFDERIEGGMVAKFGLQKFIDVLENPEEHLKI